MYSLSAFKSYDIRGVWQKEIDERFGRLMGYALGISLLEQYQNPSVLIGSDVREANLIFIHEFLIGMKEAGIHSVTCIGQRDDMPQYMYGVCSTPMACYAAIGTFDCTCLFTASHNPRDYVGIKVVDRAALSVQSEYLRELFVAHEHDSILGDTLPEIIPYADTRIATLLTEISEKYHSLKKIPKITVDYSHGSAVNIEHDFLRTLLGPESVHIFTAPDGNFPAHETDTSRFANYVPLIQAIQENGSDFGFIFDGDADRFGMVLPDGTVVMGDILLAIIAQQLLTDGTAERLGSKVIFQEVFCGRIVGDVVKKYGGILRVTRVGKESFLREVIEANALLAGEVSTHMVFKEYGMIEMPLVGLYYLFRALEHYDSATHMIAEYNTYVRGQVLHFKTTQQDAIIATIKERYRQYEQITLDGIRIEAPGFWFCIRKSNTEPLLKVALEARTKGEYDSLLAELRLFMDEHGAEEK